MISEYLANKLLDHGLGKTAFTFPSAPYIGLSKGPQVFQTALPANEPGGGAYARQQITWETADDGITFNDTKETFPNASGADWATAAAPLTHWFLADASSSGNWLFCGRLECPLVILDGDPGPIVNIRAIMLSLRGQLDS